MERIVYPYSSVIAVVISKATLKKYIKMRFIFPSSPYSDKKL